MDAVRLLLIGAPGSGKGTQAKRLAAKYGLEHIATGDRLRQQVEAHTPIGEAVAESMKRGDLVPDDLVLQLMKEPLITAGRGPGYVLDGFPRTKRQAEAAYEFASEAGVTLDAALYLRGDGELLVQRLLERAKEEGRSDDNEATIRHRMEVFEKDTLPILEYYRGRGILVTINAMEPPDAVSASIDRELTALRQRRDRQPGVDG
jgi:adenylate kinase